MSGLCFEDLSVGQSAELTRTVDEKAAWCVLMAGLRSRGLR